MTTVARAILDTNATVGASRCMDDRGAGLCWLHKGHDPDRDCEPLPVRDGRRTA